MISLAYILKRSHEPNPLSYARRPLGLLKILEAASSNGLFCSVNAVLGNSFELQTGTIQPWRGTDATVPAGIMPGNANGDVS
jgi:hypothetical protein